MELTVNDIIKDIIRYDNFKKKYNYCNIEMYYISKSLIDIDIKLKRNKYKTFRELLLNFKED